MVDFFESLKSAESIVRYREYPQPNRPTFNVEIGTHPVLISAPHGAAHHRAGKLKPEEEFTSGLARYLAQETGCSAIFSTYQDRRDPNWDNRHRYKERIKQIVEKESIRFVIDLHGMSNRYGLGIALGTINGKSCPTYEGALTETLQTAGFTQVPLNRLKPPHTLRQGLRFQNWSTFLFNHPKFTGGVVSHTVTRYVSEHLGIPAVQIELASLNRIVEREAFAEWPLYRGHPQGIRQTISALAQFIRQI